MTPLDLERAQAAARTLADRRKAAGINHCLDLIARLRGN